MSEREPVSKKLRFEIFKRDSFACQYCGKRAPDVILHCDHIVPVAEGGNSDILNLITSCADCNAGKGARQLSDHTVVNKQIDQLAVLQDKREQIEMMIEWRKGLDDLQTQAVEHAAARWTYLTEDQWTLSSTGKDRLKKTIKQFGLELTLRAMSESMDSYAKRDDDHTFLDDSIALAFTKIGSVARVLRESEERPYLRRIYYIRGILRNRLSYLNDVEAFRLMEQAAELDVNFDSVEKIAKTVRSWSAFRFALENYIKGHKGDKQ